MVLWDALRQSHRYSIRSLITIFVSWKALLLTVALFTPGSGYDSSTQILFRRDLNHPIQEPGIASAVAHKLVRWDAIYFATIAARGYTYEQEWAFGWGFTRLLAFLANYVPLSTSKLLSVAYHGIIVANVGHLLSVLILHRIALHLPLCHKSVRPQFAFIAASLHVLSPAGLFLTAPFAESLFSLFNFLGNLFYAFSYAGTGFRHTFSHDVCLIFSGLCFGLATTLRGNGLLSGAIFAFDASIWLGSILNQAGIPSYNLATMPSRLQEEVRSFPTRRLPGTLVGGVLVGVGFLTPQYIAYTEYCSRQINDRRTWCSKFPPSIYSWVQNHYWNVGFLKYWTVSNIPLFLLAVPMIYLLTESAWLAISGQCTPRPTVRASNIKRKSSESVGMDDELRQGSILVRLAIPQIAIAGLALTTFHVQIITRLSSGYPLWYLLLASDLVDKGKRDGGAETTTSPLSGLKVAKVAVKWMVMYALIQGALFASFLPPA